MEVSASLENGIINIVIKGSMDMASSMIAERHFLKYAESGKDFVLDFTDVDFIASAGIRALLTLYRVASEKDGSVTIVHPREQVVMVLEETGFAELFNI